MTTPDTARARDVADQYEYETLNPEDNIAKVNARVKAEAEKAAPGERASETAMWVFFGLLGLVFVVGMTAFSIFVGGGPIGVLVSLVVVGFFGWMFTLEDNQPGPSSDGTYGGVDFGKQIDRLWRAATCRPTNS